ncbi:ATP-binding protein [Streptomyces sp. Li-HN-5-11]|uniref:ATP-binding protein n=1 Tax=Streptomyces sp. Li-HN-5-11 TaxID=3075432 RepID=UPI0028ACDE17|nr:ATP-binding protein [Streptomyces sp. Li-HN-5-11]WNM34830.1 ATP-binding protein [Streptomyces sp. Li-HN-5-11]
MNDYFPSVLAGPRPAQYRMRLTVGEHSAGHIRRIVRSLLREWDVDGLTDTVELAVTELVANVVRHVPNRRCTLLVLRQTAGVRVEVADSSPQLPTTSGDLSPESERGRGLLLLDAVVDKWGVEPWPAGGKTVWFECGSSTVGVASASMAGRPA